MKLLDQKAIVVLGSPPGVSTSRPSGLWLPREVLHGRQVLSMKRVGFGRPRPPIQQGSKGLLFRAKLPEGRGDHGKWVPERTLRFNGKGGLKSKTRKDVLRFHSTPFRGRWVSPGHVFIPAGGLAEGELHCHRRALKFWLPVSRVTRYLEKNHLKSHFIWHFDVCQGLSPFWRTQLSFPCWGWRYCCWEVSRSVILQDRSSQTLMCIRILWRARRVWNNQRLS